MPVNRCRAWGDWWCRWGNGEPDLLFKEWKLDNFRKSSLTFQRNLIRYLKSWGEKRNGLQNTLWNIRCYYGIKSKSSSSTFCKGWKSGVATGHSGPLTLEHEHSNQTVRPSDNGVRHFTLRQQWAIILLVIDGIVWVDGDETNTIVGDRPVGV